MEEKIAALRAELEADLAAVHNKDELSAFWQKYLSKNGSVTGLTKSLRDVPKEERPAAGKTINEFKVWVEGQYQAASAEIEKAELAARNKAEAVDITTPPAHCILSPRSRMKSLMCLPAWALKFTKAPKLRTMTTTLPA